MMHLPSMTFKVSSQHRGRNAAVCVGGSLAGRIVAGVDHARMLIAFAGIPPSQLGSLKPNVTKLAGSCVGQRLCNSAINTRKAAYGALYQIWFWVLLPILAYF